MNNQSTASYIGLGSRSKENSCESAKHSEAYTLILTFAAYLVNKGVKKRTRFWVCKPIMVIALHESIRP